MVVLEVLPCILQPAIASQDVFSANLTEIYQASKTTHIRAIAKKAKCDVKDIVFFDNDYGHCQSVSKIGMWRKNAK